MALWVGVTALAAEPVTARAQRRLVYDTLSDSTPGAVTCGFCAGEAVGNVFHALDSSDGGVWGSLRPEEFPVVLRGVEVAVAAATVDGLGACFASTEGGTGSFDVAVYAGQVVPVDVRALPGTGPWPGETTVLELEGVPLELSVSDSPTAPRISVRINRIDLGVEAVRVEPPAAYLRVVLTLRGDAAGRSSVCEAGQAPVGFPMRDDDGRIGPRRGLIYARSPTPGWFWSEEVGIRGDWALRLVVTPLGGTGDAGVGAGAGSVGNDAAVVDGSAADGTAGDGPAGDRAADDGAASAATSVPGGGCGCAVVGAGPSRPGPAHSSERGVAGFRGALGCPLTLFCALFFLWSVVGRRARAPRRARRRGVRCREGLGD
jgi:hypothetical protein